MLLIVPTGMSLFRMRNSYPPLFHGMPKLDMRALLVNLIPSVFFDHFDHCPAIHVCMNTHSGPLCQAWNPLGITQAFCVVGGNTDAAPDVSWLDSVEVPLKEPV